MDFNLDLRSILTQYCMSLLILFIPVVVNGEDESESKKYPQFSFDQVAMVEVLKVGDDGINKAGVYLSIGKPEWKVETRKITVLTKVVRTEKHETKQRNPKTGEVVSRIVQVAVPVMSEQEIEVTAYKEGSLLRSIAVIDGVKAWKIDGTPLDRDEILEKFTTAKRAFVLPSHHGHFVGVDPYFAGIFDPETIVLATNEPLSVPMNPNPIQ